MQEVANSYFINLLIVDPHLSPLHQQDILDSIPKMVSHKHNEDLLKDILMEKVKVIFFYMQIGKSHELDRFLVQIFKSFWDIIEKDLTKAIKEA